MVMSTDFKPGDITFYEGKPVKIAGFSEGYVTITDEHGNGYSIPQNKLISTPLFNFYSEQAHKERNEKKVAEIKEKIKTYEKNQYLAYKAKSENASIIGQMRRDWGVTLCEANDEQRKDFNSKKNSYYSSSMEAVGWGNKINSAFSIIRSLLT